MHCFLRQFLQNRAKFGWRSELMLHADEQIGDAREIGRTSAPKQTSENAIFSVPQVVRKISFLYGKAVWSKFATW
jgi:hypothetical protein